MSEWLQRFENCIGLGARIVEHQEQIAVKEELDRLRTELQKTKESRDRMCTSAGAFAERLNEYRIDAARLSTENATIKAVLSLVPGKCLYCGLEEIAKCPRGFPGCARADDMLCGEDEASRRLIEERDTLIASLARQTARLAESVTENATLRDELETFRLGLHHQENATLRELVREALPSMEINYPVSRADWIERAKKV